MRHTYFWHSWCLLMAQSNVLNAILGNISLNVMPMILINRMKNLHVKKQGILWIEVASPKGIVINVTPRQKLATQWEEINFILINCCYLVQTNGQNTLPTIDSSAAAGSATSARSLSIRWARGRSKCIDSTDWKKKGMFFGGWDPPKCLH